MRKGLYYVNNGDYMFEIRAIEKNLVLWKDNTTGRYFFWVCRNVTESILERSTYLGKI
jgi:hypothetical protein